jgi:hypothetical protein
MGDDSTGCRAMLDIFAVNTFAEQIPGRETELR